MKNETIESRQTKWRRRALLSGVIAVLSVSAFGLAQESAPFIFGATLFLIAGYLLIDAMMGIKLRPPFDTPLRLGFQRLAESPLETGRFLTLAVLIGLLCAAAVLGLGYLLSP